ncbi:MAG: putative quinol monooxygenase [Candidatus Cybelea sp.]
MEFENAAMLVLAAKCSGKPERRNDILRLAAQVTAPSKSEAGCIAYDVHERVSGNNEFLFFEEWADQAALDFHFQTPHFREFIKELAPCLQGPPNIRVYEVARSRDLEL